MEMMMESNKIKLFKTAIAYFLFLQLAIRYAMFGPSIIEFSRKLSVTQEDMSIVYSITSVGICLGSFANGFVFKYLNWAIALPIILVTLAIQVCSVSFITDYTLFIWWYFVIGITSGISICTCENWILNIWKENCAPFCNALQLARGIGYIVGPIMVEPFMSPEKDNLRAITKIMLTNSSDQHHLVGFNLSQEAFYRYDVVQVKDANESQHSLNSTQSMTTQIYIPYLINGILIAVAALMIFLSDYFTLLPTIAKVEQQKSRKSLSDSTETLDHKHSVGINMNQIDISKPKMFAFKLLLPKPYLIWIISLCSIFYLFFFEEVIVTYLATFSGNIDLHLSKSGGAFLTSLFNLANIFGKATGIVLAMFFSPIYILYLDLVLIMTGLLVLLFYANSSILLLWIGVLILGFGLASVIAALYAVMQRCIEMSNMVCGILNMCGTLGSVIIPLIISAKIESHPLVLIYACLTCTIACAVLLAILHLTIAWRSKTFRLI